MPLRYIRSRVTTGDVLSVAIATTSATQNLASLASFPAVGVPAAILLKIFETIQDVQTNRTDCYRLANRCFSMLVDIRDQMEDRWETAPASLIKAIQTFERTLESIYDFLKGEADNKWTTRLLRKGRIESALIQFNISLDDAARSFQIATLINIHYAIGDKRSEQTLPLSAEGVSTASSKTICPSDDRSSSTEHIIITSVEELVSSPATDSFLSSGDVRVNSKSSTVSEDYVLIYDTPSNSICINDDDSLPLTEADIAALGQHGFRRYHQSDLVLRGRSRIKGGWWAGSTEVQADGRNLLLRRYEEPRSIAMKKWIRDVKILQNVFHPNLPQMVGYSGEECPTPFILLANVQTRLPQALVIDTIKNADLATCVQLIVRFYKDTWDAALYMQRQLNLSDSKIQDYVENASYRIDAEQTLVMGLPPPEVDAWTSWRNFGLAHSIRGIFLKLLPNQGYVSQSYDITDDGMLMYHVASIDKQLKINHLSMILNALLPSVDDATTVSTRLRSLLSDDDDEGCPRQQLTLRQIRLAALKTNLHEQAWRQKLAPAHKYEVGDLGYVQDGEDLDSFKVLCNVFQDELASMDVSCAANGMQFSWENGFHSKQELQCFPCPGGMQGWTVVIPPGSRENVQIIHEAYVTRTSQAWQYILDHGKKLADKYSIKPEDLILVTRVGIDQRFVMQSMDLSHRTNHFAMPGHQRHAQGFGHASQPHFMHSQPHYSGFGLPPAPPVVMYLFTSLDKDKKPTWSDTPSHGLNKQDQRMELRTRCSVIPENQYGFFNYVQLHSEDFA